MFVPDGMKVNKFKDVNIPSNKEYFGRFGFHDVKPDAYTGDEVAKINVSKVDEVADYMAYAEMMANESKD